MNATWGWEIAHQTSTGPLDASGLRTFMGRFRTINCGNSVIDKGEQIRCANTAANVLFASDVMTGRAILDLCVPDHHPRSGLERRHRSPVTWISRSGRS